MSVTLRDKIYGCICGAHIGSAMGAVVEGWPHERIDEIYGTLDRFAAYEHYGNGWVREAGSTEDGIDRQKLMITAIIEKGGRINAEDLRRIGNARRMVLYGIGIDKLRTDAIAKHQPVRCRPVMVGGGEALIV